jgi:thioredoxin 1
VTNLKTSVTCLDWIAMTENVDEHNLAKQITVNKKVVALFYSSWCPFCRSFLPVFSKFAQNADSKIFLKVKLDDDDDPMWETYSLESVPSILFFENERIARRLDCELGVGLTERQVSEWLKSIK